MAKTENCAPALKRLLKDKPDQFFELFKWCVLVEEMDLNTSIWYCYNELIAK